MRTGQCFILYGEQRKGYFYTGIQEEEKGETILVMCEMLPREKITMESFLRISESEYQEKKENGTIEEF